MPPPAHTPVSPPPKLTPPHLPDELLDLVSSINRVLQDLESFQIPQLAACKGPLTLHEQLAGDVRNEMGGLRRDLEELKLQVDDLDKARDRRAGLDLVERAQKWLNVITGRYREAVITSKVHIQAEANLSPRDLLLRSHTPVGGKGRATTSETNASADDALMAATSDVTEGLRRTLQLMQQELDRSLISTEMLQSQTATMQMTSDQYSIFSTLLTTSKALITSLERADVLDRLILLFAFIFFCLCCAWVVKRRVVDKGLRVAGAVVGVVTGGGPAAKVELKRSLEDAVVESVAVLTAAATLAASSILSALPTQQSSVEERRTVATPATLSAILDAMDDHSETVAPVEVQPTLSSSSIIDSPTALPTPSPVFEDSPTSPSEPSSPSSTPTPLHATPDLDHAHHHEALASQLENMDERAAVGGAYAYVNSTAAVESSAAPASSSTLDLPTPTPTPSSPPPPPPTLADDSPDAISALLDETDARAFDEIVAPIGGAAFGEPVVGAELEEEEVLLEEEPLDFVLEGEVESAEESFEAEGEVEGESVGAEIKAEEEEIEGEVQVEAEEEDIEPATPEPDEEPLDVEVEAPTPELDAEPLDLQPEGDAESEPEPDPTLDPSSPELEVESLELEFEEPSTPDPNLDPLADEPEEPELSPLPPPIPTDDDAAMDAFLDLMDERSFAQIVAPIGAVYANVSDDAESPPMATWIEVEPESEVEEEEEGVEEGEGGEPVHGTIHDPATSTLSDPEAPTSAPIPVPTTEAITEGEIELELEEETEEAEAPEPEPEEAPTAELPVATAEAVLSDDDAPEPIPTLAPSSLSDEESQPYETDEEDIVFTSLFPRDSPADLDLDVEPSLAEAECPASPLVEDECLPDALDPLLHPEPATVDESEDVFTPHAFRPATPNVDSEAALEANAVPSLNEVEEAEEEAEAREEESLAADRVFDPDLVSPFRPAQPVDAQAPIDENQVDEDQEDEADEENRPLEVEPDEFEFEGLVTSPDAPDDDAIVLSEPATPEDPTPAEDTEFVLDDPVELPSSVEEEPELIFTPPPYLRPGTAYVDPQEAIDADAVFGEIGAKFDERGEEVEPGAVPIEESFDADVVDANATATEEDLPDEASKVDSALPETSEPDEEVELPLEPAGEELLREKLAAADADEDASHRDIDALGFADEPVFLDEHLAGGVIPLSKLPVGDEHVVFDEGAPIDGSLLDAEGAGEESVEEEEGEEEFGEEEEEADDEPTDIDSVTFRDEPVHLADPESLFEAEEAGDELYTDDVHLENEGRKGFSEEFLEAMERERGDGDSEEGGAEDAQARDEL